MAATEGQFFISYRRADSRGDTGRLYDRLAAEFGPAAVFRDIDGIAPGEPFARVLQNSLSRCDALLAVIGPDWLPGEAGGRRRLDDPADFVRLEIVAALERGIPVIPVLVGGAGVPAADDLPAPLAPLAGFQGAVLHDLHFHADVDMLIDRLRAIAGTRVRRAATLPREVCGDAPWLCRDPDWFADEPEPVWPALAIDWPPEAVHAVRDGPGGAVTAPATARVAVTLERLWRAFGVIVPGICMRHGESGRFVVRVAGVPAAEGDAGDDPLEGPIAALEAAIRDDPKTVVGHQEVASLLTTQGEKVLDAVLAEPRALTDLVLVCRALLAEHVSIAPLDAIVPAFRRLRPTGASLVEIVEELRRVPEVRASLPANDERHRFLTFGRRLERAFATSLDAGAGQAVLAMEPGTMQEALAAVQEGVAEVSGAVAIVVGNASIRPFVRQLIALAYPYLWVLSERELLVELEPRAVGEVEIG